MSNGILTLAFSEWITIFFELMYLTSIITVQVTVMFVCKVVALTIWWAPRGLVTITKIERVNDYFIIMIFFYRIKLHDAIIWFFLSFILKKSFLLSRLKQNSHFHLMFWVPFQVQKSQSQWIKYHFPSHILGQSQFNFTPSGPSYKLPVDTIIFNSNSQLQTTGTHIIKKTGTSKIS